MTKEEILERLKENIAELKYTFQIYQDTSHEEYSSEDEMEIAKTKMRYAKEYVLAKSLELKRALKKLEGHL